jgi:hypothetical protein
MILPLDEVVIATILAIIYSRMNNEFLATLKARAYQPWNGDGLQVKNLPILRVMDLVDLRYMMVLE